MPSPWCVWIALYARPVESRDRDTFSSLNDNSCPSLYVSVPYLPQRPFQVLWAPVTVT